MQLLSVGRTPRNPTRCGRLNGHHFCFGPGIAGRETEAANKNGKPDVSGLPKLAVEEGERAGAVKKDGKKVASSELTKTEKAETDREDAAPGQKGPAKNRSALKNDASPLALREQKHDAAGKEFSAAIRADAQTISADRRASHQLESFGKTFQHSQRQAARDALLLLLGRHRETLGNNANALAKNRQMAGGPEENRSQKKIAAKRCHRARLYHQNNSKRRDDETDRQNGASASGDGHAHNQTQPAGQEQPVLILEPREQGMKEKGLPPGRQRD